MKHGEFLLTTRRRKGEPQLGMSTSSGRLRFESRVQAGTASDTLGAVYAGNDAATEYEKVRAKGKVVVIERSDEVPPQSRPVRRR
ncbi:hypothetical protein OHA98_25855 [Streptomyces sp. NBC_00654]|uniref:hypothetical protein n=1 Tax=Streptomyces sp. NBC_00654 TaxID=2975799 RepID=UPI00224CC48C|nr:hypothetical protein [Streptomyces sp. NBC_00654]MCX4968121.1 hypothetical protein [Streptomyces sp. NBC_00654]